MAGPLDFTGQNIEDSYQRVLQTDGKIITDGTGSFVNLQFTGSFSGDGSGLTGIDVDNTALGEQVANIQNTVDGLENTVSVLQTTSPTQLTIKLQQTHLILQQTQQTLQACNHRLVAYKTQLQLFQIR